MTQKLHSKVHWHLIGKTFFSGVSAQERERFFALTAKRELKRNEQVFAEGDTAKSCYYIEKGVIRAHRNTLEGKCPILFIRGQGDIFGLAELVNGEPRHCAASAMTPAVIHELPEAGFEQILENSPGLSRKMMEVLGRRVRYLNEQVQDFMQHGVGERLLKLFVCLSYGLILDALPENRPVSLPLRITQEEMGAMIGSCQQTISASLRAMQDEGYIAMNGRAVTLLNPRAILDALGLS